MHELCAQSSADVKLQPLLDTLPEDWCIGIAGQNWCAGVDKVRVMQTDSEIMLSLKTCAQVPPLTREDIDSPHWLVFNVPTPERNGERDGLFPWSFCPGVVDGMCGHKHHMIAYEACRRMTQNAIVRFTKN